MLTWRALNAKLDFQVVFYKLAKNKLKKLMLANLRITINISTLKLRNYVGLI